MRIGILGLGGVGGYLGARLANEYCRSNDIEIVFIARPETETVISKNGLKLITQSGEITVKPHLVSSSAIKIGCLDFLICTVKSYDLEESLIPLKSCIDEETVILPLLNGVDAKDRIKAVYPQANVLDGCIYIVSRRTEPGIIREFGNSHSLHFGSGTISKDVLKFLASLLTGAGISCYLSEHSERTVWEKFFFTAGMANMTSYADLSIGQILKTPEHRDMMRRLLQELKEIADSKNILFEGDIIEDTLAKMEKLPPENTSSMHSDFQKGSRTEYKSITEFVVDLGDQLEIETPFFDLVLAEFKSRR